MSTNFQNSINAGLGIAAGAAVASGKSATRKEEKLIKGLQETLQEEKKAGSEAVKAAENVPKKYIPNKKERETLQKGIEANQRLAEISGKISESRERQFAKRPSPESWGNLQQARKAQQDYERLADRDIQRLQQANERAKRRREAAKAQRQTIKDIMNTPIDGGVIADLGPEAQKIAIQALRGEKNGKRK